MDQENGQRVLISGAGIAGLTAAYWLVRNGWSVVVLEKADALRKGEYMIDFAGTGWDVAVRMGLEEELRRCHLPLDYLTFQDGEGRDRARVAMANFVSSMGVEDKYAALNRCDLEELLYEQVKDDVELRFGASIASLQEDDEGAHVVLEDGTSERYDLVIGADGLHSNVRKLLFGDEKEYAKYLGYRVASFRVHNYEGPVSRCFSMLRTPNRQAGVLHVEEGSALAYFVYKSESDAYVPRAERKQELMSVFGDLGGPIPGILKTLDDDMSIYMDTATQIVMPKWYAKRVVLIGDAAYCLTLISGQGASMAMGGAYALAEALAAHPDDLTAAMAAYELRLRSFIEELQEKAARFANSFVPSSRFGLWFTELAIRWMRFGWIQKYVSKQFNIQSIFEREATPA